MGRTAFAPAITGRVAAGGKVAVALLNTADWADNVGAVRLGAWPGRGTFDNL
jgi:hypothetical protein